MPLPTPAENGDKENRGRVLIVGGAPSMPGAAVLAATAALRAGAGKLQIAAPASIAQAIGIAVPEALVIALPETRGGGIAPRAAERVLEHAASSHGVLVGPGMVDRPAAEQLVAELVRRLQGPTLVLDAEGMSALTRDHGLLRHAQCPVVLTPHAGEMATLMGLSKEEVQARPAEVAVECARRLGSVVALKGAETFIAAPGRGAPLFHNKAGNVGLATSGSGDTLSGVVAGLAARGAAPQQATAWAVYLHATAGDRLARRIGTLGFLARELLGEIPVVMHALR